MPRIKQHAFFRNTRKPTRPLIAGKYDPGYSKVTNALADIDIPRDAKLLHVMLGRHVNAKGQCWPSRARLAAECGMSVDSIDRALKWLVRSHMWTVENRQAQELSNLYTAVDLRQWTAPLRPTLAAHSGKGSRTQRQGVAAHSGTKVYPPQGKPTEGKPISRSSADARESLHSQEQDEKPEPEVTPTAEATPSAKGKEDGGKTEDSQNQIAAPAEAMTATPSCPGAAEAGTGEAARFITEAVALIGRTILTPADWQKYHRQLATGLAKYGLTLVEAHAAYKDFFRSAKRYGDDLLDYRGKPITEFGFFPTVVFRKYAEKRAAAQKPRPALKIPERPVDPPGTVQTSLVDLLLKARRERTAMQEAA